MSKKKNKHPMVYEMECDTCGHFQVDNIPWTNCLIQGCKGKYIVVAENLTGR